MKIAHFSDPHLGAPVDDWTALFDKRWVGLFNYKFRRSYQHDPSYLERAVQYILENNFDVVLFDKNEYNLFEYGFSMLKSEPLAVSGTLIDTIKIEK